MNGRMALRVLLLILAYALIVAAIILLAGCCITPKEEWKSSLRVYRCGELIYEVEAGSEKEKP